MAVGLSPATAAEILDAIGNNSTWTAGATIGIKLHIGDPGAAGTSNAAGNTTLQSVSFGAAVAGAMANDVAISWTNVSTSEDYTHFSLWDGTTGPGTNAFQLSGTVTANAVTAGDTFTIPIGDLDITAGVAS